ncbi:LysR family transcriptional regulator [Marinobacter bryozoorum]|jgi:DNA-binding transcriptional LysR family regulator|uniref:LysR family transcriptional regulator n=1 Tax=Marinobacter bryozoorum TaxID=256324 RepID=UPI0020061277|nr:LysR family transcriptional regulator [Marinobacter bryozoorum]MCK7545768.1 LysR family transcriptional regulator [Marinobacter bryozoorum]
MDWDYLRYVHALANGGTLARAGELLGVHQTTVLRRLDQMEGDLDTRLFERNRDGLALTPAGELAYREAERLAIDIENLERRLAGQETDPEGRVRVATTDSLLNGLLAPLLGELVASYPGLDVEAVTSTDVAGLTLRDADLVLRPTNQPQETLVGHRVGTIESAIYGSQGYVEKQPFDESDLPGDHVWVIPDESFVHLATGRWYRRNLRRAGSTLRCNSLYGMFSLVSNGGGLGVLPCYLGDAAPELVRLSDPLEGESIDLWLLAHQDLRKMARVRVAMDFLAQRLRDRQRQLEGQP